MGPNFLTNRMIDSFDERAIISRVFTFNLHCMRKITITLFLILACSLDPAFSDGIDISKSIDNKDFDPSTVMWYESPAKSWEEALPVGNGRIGAMVFGKYGEERIQLNKETYWTGGPYSTVIKDGYKVLPEIQKNIVDGNSVKAHKLFGRYLMGYTVEQQ